MLVLGFCYRGGGFVFRSESASAMGFRGGWIDVFGEFGGGGWR